MHPRYFIGIKLPDLLVKRIEKPQKEFLAVHKVMEPLVPHITLLHPNILMTLSPLYLVPRVKQVASESLPFTVELTKTAMFDSRILHIAIKSPELLTLHKKLVKLLPDDIRARYEIARDYMPHVTLIQAKPLQKLDDSLINDFKKEIDPFLPTTMEVRKLNQFTWLAPRKYKVNEI